MKEGDVVLILPKSTRYPGATRLRGRQGYLLQIEGGLVAVLVDGQIRRFRIHEVAPARGCICSRCEGEGEVPRRGVWNLVPGRAWQDCPDCEGRGYNLAEEENV